MRNQTRHSTTHVGFIDLERDAAQLLDPDAGVSELIVSDAPATTGTVDVAGVVCLARLQQLPAHVDALARLLAARESVARMVFVLVGRPAGMHRGEPLVLPTLLEAADAALLWLADPRGVVWEEGSSRARRETHYPADANGEGSLRALIEALRLPEVFNAISQEIAGHTAVYSPALRVIVPGPCNAALLHAAQVNALMRLGDEGPPTIPPVTPVVNHPQLNGPATAPRRVFRADRGLGASYAELEAAHARAVAQSAALRRRPRPKNIQAAAAAVVRCAQLLGKLRSDVRAIVTAIDPSDGLSCAERHQLTEAGVEENLLRTQDDHSERQEHEDTLRDFVLGELHQQRSLAQSATLLRAIADKTRPRGGDRPSAWLEQWRPGLEEQLQTKSRPSLHTGRTALVAQFGFFAATLQLPAAWPVLPLTALALLMIYASLLLEGPRSRRAVAALQTAAGSRATWAHIGVLTLGLAVGLSLRLALNVSAPIALSALLSPALLALYVSLTWRQSLARWEEASGLAALGPGLQELGTCLREMVIQDWMFANERARLASTLSCLADSVEHLRERLHPIGNPRARRAAQPASFACNPAIREDLSAERNCEPYQYSDEIEELVLLDHLDAIANAIEAEWPLVTAAAGEPSRAIRRRFDSWLADYRRMLADAGLFAPTSSADVVSDMGRRRRVSLLNRLWQRTEIERMLAESDQLVQLCSAKDLKLLDQQFDASILVRFAPDTRDVAETTQTGVFRTASQLMAGVLKLTPLRRGAVSFATPCASGLRSEPLHLSTPGAEEPRHRLNSTGVGQRRGATGPRPTTRTRDRAAEARG